MKKSNNWLLLIYYLSVFWVHANKWKKCPKLKEGKKEPLMSKMKYGILIECNHCYYKKHTFKVFKKNYLHTSFWWICLQTWEAKYCAGHCFSYGDILWPVSVLEELTIHAWKCTATFVKRKKKIFIFTKYHLAIIYDIVNAKHVKLV